MHCGKKNGTYINSIRIPNGKRYLLKQDSILNLSKYALKVKIEEGEDIEDDESLERELLKEVEGGSATEFDIEQDDEFNKI